MSTLVIGAGIAGLAAAQTLVKAGEGVVVLEARGRAGGRIFTNHTFASVPVELGGEFLHGDQISTWELVRELGLNTVLWAKGDDALVRLSDGSLRTMAEARQVDPDWEITRSWALPDIPATPDESLHDYLKRVGFNEDALQYTRRAFGNAKCEALTNISAQSTLERLHDTTSGEGDFRILEGYDRLVNALAKGLDIRFGLQVESIDWSTTRVRVRCRGKNADETFTADNCIVTVPLGVLRSGRVRFTPPLPVEKQSAINALRMGPAVKLVYRFAAPITPPDISAIYSMYNPPMWWTPNYGREDGTEQVWMAFATGDWARDLLSDGEHVALARGLDTLRTELDNPDLVPTDRFIMNWTTDPFTFGGYSVALPGAANARGVLARPLANRVFWAGEATAPNWEAATVHGAYNSGRRAAAEVLASSWV